mmetsp:Transcript_113624/g.220368  ORF Transcript_113624/g.220368 Transcript_113624/m.220368 type:complete len:475 (-) Transcript_113624:92-1516(-)
MAALVRFCFARGTGNRWSSSAKQFLGSGGNNSKLVFIPDAINSLGACTTVTTITGPSRQGKSSLANALCGRPNGFAVSSNPMHAHTHGAWAINCAQEKQSRHIIVDTEGLTSNVSKSTRLSFLAVYPLSTNMVFSTKDPGADAFLNQLDELHANMGDFLKSNQSKKPRGILLLRDAESFEFAMRGSSYVAHDGKSFHEYTQSLLAGRPAVKGLFSSFRAFAIPSIKNLKGTDLSSVGDMPKLMQFLNQPHAGQLVNLRDVDAMKNLIDGINKNGVFDASSMTAKLFEVFGSVRGNTGVQEEFAALWGWDGETLVHAFDKSVSDIKASFPLSKSNLVELERAVLVFAYRIQHPDEEECYENGIIGYKEEAAGSACTAFGTFAGAALGGMALASSVASGGATAAVYVMGARVLTGQAAGAVCGGLMGGGLGGAAGHACEEKRKVPVEGRVRKTKHILGNEPSSVELSDWLKTLNRS